MTSKEIHILVLSIKRTGLLNYFEVFAPHRSHFSFNKNIFAPPCTLFSCNKWKNSAHPVRLIDSWTTSKMRKLVENWNSENQIPCLRHLCSTIYSMFTLQPSCCFWSFIINMKTPFDPSKEFLIEYCLTTETLLPSN